eukprot:1116889-Amphidinium_carterae.1
MFQKAFRAKAHTTLPPLRKSGDAKFAVNLLHYNSDVWGRSKWSRVSHVTGWWLLLGANRPSMLEFKIWTAAWSHQNVRSAMLQSMKAGWTRSCTHKSSGVHGRIL